uniref:Uncharacterized protein n=1 Tax=Panagrolaimus sp. JU765 TaxID=591449 RepID=A0AC34QHM5_9BILA
MHIIFQNEPVEQRVAQGINNRVDNAADSITNFRNGVSDFGQAAHDKFVGAAQSVGNAAANVGAGIRQGVQNTGQAIGNGWHYVYDGAGNIIGTAENAVGRKLENAGNALQNH